MPIKVIIAAAANVNKNMHSLLRWIFALAMDFTVLFKDDLYFSTAILLCNSEKAFMEQCMEPCLICPQFALEFRYAHPATGRMSI